WHELATHLGEHSLPIVKLFSARAFDGYWMSGLVRSLAANPSKYEENLGQLKRIAEQVRRDPERARLDDEGLDSISPLEPEELTRRFGMDHGGWQFSVTPAPGARR